jgi:hypothetical protein
LYQPTLDYLLPKYHLSNPLKYNEPSEPLNTGFRKEFNLNSTFFAKKIEKDKKGIPKTCI